MRRPGGYGVATGPEGVFEIDTFTCSHCNSIVEVPVGTRPEDLGGFCRPCGKLICSKCVDKSARGETCRVWEKQCEDLENAVRKQAAVDAYFPRDGS